MKVNRQILSIPPYLSTSWERVNTLRLQETDLLIYLESGEVVTIPDLKPDFLESLFDYHLIALEEKQNSTSSENSSLVKRSLAEEFVKLSGVNETSFKIGIGGAGGEIASSMRHNPEMADSPDLPEQVLEKISALSKIFSSEDIVIPSAEPCCNCPYCQIARTLQHKSALPDVNVSEEGEDVCEEDLRFQEWDISQSGEKLFSVVNKLDSHEKYSVYLGHPVGCTCGKSGCEHILAVLKS